MDIGGSALPLVVEAPATPLPPTRNNGQTPTQEGLTAGPGQLSSTPPRVVLTTDRGSVVSAITNATNAASATTPDHSRHGNNSGRTAVTYEAISRLLEAAQRRQLCGIG